MLMLSWNITVWQEDYSQKSRSLHGRPEAGVTWQEEAEVRSIFPRLTFGDLFFFSHVLYFRKALTLGHCFHWLPHWHPLNLEITTLKHREVLCYCFDDFLFLSVASPYGILSFWFTLQCWSCKPGPSCILESLEIFLYRISVFNRLSSIAYWLFLSYFLYFCLAF